MPALPPRADLDQLRRIAKDRLRAARDGDAEAVQWIGEADAGLTLAAAQLRLARHYDFASWSALQLEIARRIDMLIADGTPVDAEDEVFGRHPLRLAAANGRPRSVRALLAHGADPARRDANGLTPLDHCRRGRARAPDTTGHVEAEALLAPPRRT